MAYLGHFEKFISIDGEPVDLSRIDEGIIMAGDEEYDADEMITDEDRLDVFNETALTTQDELVKSLDEVIGKIEEESKTDKEHSPAFYARYKELVVQFRDKIRKMTFPSKLEDWWRYEYEVRESGASLRMSHIDYFRFDRHDFVDEHVDTTFDLFDIKTKLLTVEQYAQVYGVTTTTVRQWIRRGKLRTEVKAGSEWRIPELAECLSRKYGCRRYTRKEILTDLPEGYAFFNEYAHVTLSQNEKQKDLFDVCFSKELDVMDFQSEEDFIRENYREIQMDQKEREKFELYLISEPFVQPTEVCFVSREY